MRWLPSLLFSNNSSSAAAVDHHRRKASAFKKDRCFSAEEPRPLPLPELSSSLIRVRDADFPLPSPKDAAPPSAARAFRMRSVFASQEKRKSMEQGENRPTRKLHQDVSGSESTRDNNINNNNSNNNNQNLVKVPGRSVSTLTSPFASPLISPHRRSTGDFVPYYYVSPRGNQFWSAPEMPTTELGMTPPPAFFDLSALATAEGSSSPQQSPQGRSPQRNPRSLSGPPSPVHPMMSPEISGARLESNVPVGVHPLPLPPGAALSSPSAAAATFSHAGANKSEALPMNLQWQKGKLIGRGTFGSVYAATHRVTGALCAMKEVEICPGDPKSAECMKQLEQEIKVLSRLEHPNIVQYYGSEIFEDRFYIYLEYVHPGSINKYVREHCGAVTECVLRNFTRHILSGLAYLHSKKTIHRDIKGANLLVDSAGVVKLADFGMAKHLTGCEANLSLRGSPYWMAPELMQAVIQKDNSADLAFAIDIWSLGCTIIEMFTGKPPWSEYEGAAAMFKVMRDTPPIPETLSPEGKDFLRCCFKRNPAERPPATVLLEHRFLKNPHKTDGTSFMDKTQHSPRGQSENKAYQMSAQSTKIAKGKAAERRGFLIPSLDILPAHCDQ